MSKNPRIYGNIGGASHIYKEDQLVVHFYDALQKDVCYSA